MALEKPDWSPLPNHLARLPALPAPGTLCTVTSGHLARNKADGCEGKRDGSAVKGSKIRNLETVALVWLLHYWPLLLPVYPLTSTCWPQVSLSHSPPPPPLSPQDECVINPRGGGEQELERR